MQSKRSWCTSIFLTAILFSFSFKCLAQGKEELKRLTIQYQQAEKADNDSLRVLAMAALATHHMVNDPELALEYSKKQFRLAEKIDLKWGLANAYNVQGGVYDYKGDYKRALERYSKAIIAYTALGRKMDLVDIYNSIGIVYSKQGINSEALTNMLKGLQLAISEKYDLGIVSSYNNIGIVYESQQQYDEALKYYLKCLRVQRKLGKGYYKHATLSNIGNLYLIKKQPSLALKYYTEGVEDAILEADDPSLANNYSGIGDVYTYTKQWDKALDNHKKAFDIRNNMNDIFGLKASYLSLGEIYLKTGNYPDALKATQKTAELVKETGELKYHAEAYEQLSNIYEAMGNYPLAYQNHKLYKKYNDSIFNEGNTKKLTEQQMNFDFKLVQEKKDAVARQSLSFQKDLRNYTIAGLLIIAAFVFILFRQRYKLATIRKQKAHEITLNKLENEMALKDLESQTLKTENENILLKEEKMQERLDYNQRELASATLYLYQKNEMLSGLRKEIDTLHGNSDNKKQFEKIRSAMQGDHHAESDWERFRIHFEQVHPDFFKKLAENHPGLTAYEVRLCAYLHLKMATKEIAGLLNITPESVIKAKVRLNKKLNSQRGNDNAENS